MTTRQKLIEFLIFTTAGFTVGQALVFLLIVANRSLYSNLAYHYSDNLTWYMLFFGLPFVTGLAFYFGHKGKNLSEDILTRYRVIFLAQMVFAVISIDRNYTYWGYVFKRPVVFKEVSKAVAILECSSVMNFDSTGIKPLYVAMNTTGSIDNLFGRKDPYYGNVDRPFMVFQDNSSRYPDLYDFSEVHKDTSRNISKDELLSIDTQIQNTGIIDKGEKKYNYDHLGRLAGIVTKFQTTSGKNYIFAGLDGGEVSNDHYPFYEFLFIEKNGSYKLIKKQKYYTDFAGGEGFEHVYIAPFFSLTLAIFGLASLMIFFTKTKKTGIDDNQ